MFFLEYFGGKIKNTEQREAILVYSVYKYK